LIKGKEEELIKGGQGEERRKEITRNGEKDRGRDRRKRIYRGTDKCRGRDRRKLIWKNRSRHTVEGGKNF
jgi:hypothetical protein